eukprot:CAMPEP_0184505360 /NCGR_PEP_ID=MMETSP0113_2-20130426/52945_1 /TAXON_ID=91329 /ORGANISM="Norrisiella sphaerica, Strain BC52" /LENGTH=50 /DNA_ID=CAMNT_0026895047 /DNA_START=538 /DNA_END=690 /DNA_ORIENTATION=-
MGQNKKIFNKEGKTDAGEEEGVGDLKMSENDNAIVINDNDEVDHDDSTVT